MQPNLVNPADWQNHEVIFDDGDFSAVWGQYKGIFCLGTRWNGDGNDERGYPGQGAYPLWFIIPEYLTLSVLERLNTISIQSDLRDDNNQAYSDNINATIREFLNSRPVEAQN